MRNSDPARRRLPIAGKILLFLLLFFLMITALNALLVPNGSIARYYREKQSYDAVLMGNSTVLYLAPLLVDEVSGLDTYNLSSPMQTLSSSYEILRESIAHGAKPDTVLLYLHIRRFQREEGTQYDYGIVHDLTGARKLEMLKNDFRIDEYPEALLPCMYQRDRLLSAIDSILGTDAEEPSAIDEGTAVSRRIAQDAETAAAYFGKGFLSTSTIHQDPARIALGFTDHFYTDQLNQSALESLGKIVSTCRENGIDLVFFTLPALPGNLLATSGEGYGAFHDFAASLAKQYGVPFWDLTYLRPEIAAVDCTFFMDSRHGNASFTLLFSKLLGQMLREYRQGVFQPERYFYDDYETYLETYHGINGLYSNGKIHTLQDASDRQYVVVNAALGADTEVEYRVSLLTDGGEPVLLRDWNRNDHAVIGKALPAGDYTLRIEARQRGGDAPEQTLDQVFTLEA